MGEKVGKLKRGRRPPPFFAGEVSLPFLAGLLLPALGFLRHCLLSPPSCGFCVRERSRHLRDCRLARSRDAGALRVGAPLIFERVRSSVLLSLLGTSLGVVYVDHPHTRYRLWTRKFLCQAQCVGKVKKIASGDCRRASSLRASRERCTQLRVGLRGCADRLRRMQRDDDFQLLNRFVDPIHREQLGGETQARAHFGRAPRRHAPASARSSSSRHAAALDAGSCR